MQFSIQLSRLLLVLRRVLVTSHVKDVFSIQVLSLVRFSWKIPGPQVKILNIHPSEGVILPNENQVFFVFVLFFYCLPPNVIYKNRKLNKGK